MEIFQSIPDSTYTRPIPDPIYTRPIPDLTHTNKIFSYLTKFGTAYSYFLFFLKIILLKNFKAIQIQCLS